MKRAIPGLLIAFATLALMALLPASAAAAPPSNNADVGDKPTFYGEVLPILQDNCQVCHRPNGANLGGMVAPMAFTTYAETRPWARSIARQAEARLMPPWHASPEHAGVFTNERTLEESQIATLVKWAKSGAPAGDVASAPPPKEWPSNDGWTFGEPDLVLDMGQEYFVEDDVEDQYIDFEITITEDQLPSRAGSNQSNSGLVLRWCITSSLVRSAALHRVTIRLSTMTASASSSSRAPR